MLPVLFRIGEIPVYAYGVSMVVALGVGFLAMLVAALRLRSSIAAAVVVATVMPLPMMVGAKVGWWLTNLEAARTAGDWSGGGLALTPALLVALASAAALSPAFKERVGATLDVAVIGLLSAMAVGRFGCFLAGCCFGRPTELPWGLVFPAPGLMPEELHGVRVHPTQLYLLAVCVALAAGLFWRGARRRFPGELALVAAAVWGVLSLGSPFLRYGEELRLSTAFGWSAVIVLAVGGLVVLSRNARGEPGGVATPPAQG